MGGQTPPPTFKTVAPPLVYTSLSRQVHIVISSYPLNYNVTLTLLQQFPSYSNHNCKKIVVFTYPAFIFCLPRGRPCDNHAKRCMNEKTIQCLPNPLAACTHLSSTLFPVIKQAYRVVHQPVSRGFAVFADAWLSGWLAEISADLREAVAH